MQICGRCFTQQEIDWIRDQIQSDPDLSRQELSRRFCHHVGWFKPDGGPKEMSCKTAMLRMDKAGIIELPSPKKRIGSVGLVKRTPAGEPKPSLVIDPGESLCLEPVHQGVSALWNELIDRYHYLGYRRLAGAQMRFFVYAKEHLVAVLGFSAAAWKVACRDRFIGWSDRQRREHLHLVVNNSRFLILPWIEGRNLASKILSCASRRLPEMWNKRYGYRPVLLETFVETPRFLGTCYKAANWIRVGQSQGRGKWDRNHLADKPIKTVWLYPLHRRFQEILCR